MMAESFRVVMTSMLISGQNGQGWRTLVCTSPNAAEGKTTVAANLAVALGRIGKRVVLIDADLSQPALHHTFAIDNDHGLTGLLRDDRLTSEAIRDAIRHTRFGVSVLSAGPHVPDAANLLFAGNMGELLAKLKDDFDIVLIDTPPTPQMPHARVLGSLADGVILVVRAGRTTRAAVSATLQRFAADQIPVLGTILNDWNPHRSPSDYYYNQARRTAAESHAPSPALWT